MMSAIRDEGVPIEVLLIEDSPGDVRLTREVFRDANRAIRLSVACDGVEAMAFLRQDGAYVDAPRPDLILLDLNLPKMDGREVLAQIKADHSLKTIPTVIRPRRTRKRTLRKATNCGPTVTSASPCSWTRSKTW
jgi:CheY-like chemotaxis protein